MLDLLTLVVFWNHFGAVIWLPKGTIVALQSVGEVKAAASLPGLQLLICLGFLSPAWKQGLFSLQCASNISSTSVLK